MNLKNSYKTFTIFLLLLMVSLSGCSKQPWHHSVLPEIEDQQYRELFSIIKEEHRQCTKRFDAEASLLLKSSLKNESVKGYLATIVPQRAKFIVTTPLGQPAYIATINGKAFQSINVLGRSYQSGQITEVVDEFDLPQILKEVEIGELVEAKLSEKLGQPEKVRLDLENRGIWYSIAHGQKQEHFLVDLEQKVLIERIVENEKDDSVTIHYAEHQNIIGCAQPTVITVSGLSFGTRIEIQLDDILPQPLLTQKDFHIKIPAGFIKQSIKK